MNNIIVVDFETGSIDPHTCEITQLAAVAIDKQSLTIHENGRFQTLCKPYDFNKLEAKALEITKIKVEDLEKAPQLDHVWSMFSAFVQRFGKGWGAPVMAGHNVDRFDAIIVKRLDSKFNNGKTLFHPIHSLDTMKLCFMWLESLPDVKKYNLDYLRDYFGLPKDQAHDALFDCVTCANLIIRFLKFMRHHAKATKFQGAFAN